MFPGFIFGQPGKNAINLRFKSSSSLIEPPSHHPANQQWWLPAGPDPGVPAEQPGRELSPRPQTGPQLPEPERGVQERQKAAGPL